jgi:two-component system OmpR family response regulator
MRLLLIEDDPDIASEIISGFAAQGYAVTHTADGADGLALARSGDFDAMIVDRNLPGMDGLAIVQTLRGESITTPALFLSALGDVENRVHGLMAGGDDYLGKPFHLFELTARIEALLRRSSRAPETVLHLGPLCLDLVARKAMRGERQIELLPREFKLLEYLMRHSAQVVTRAMLLQDVWNYTFAAETNVVDVHVCKLRRKVDGPDEARMLHSIRSVGFTLRAPE